MISCLLNSFKPKWLYFMHIGNDFFEIPLELESVKQKWIKHHLHIFQIQVFKTLTVLVKSLIFW